MIENLNIEAVVIGERFRKDAGDIESLAESIRRVGLLHAIVVDAGNGLICGFRRLQACRSLGWETIPAHRVAGFAEAVDFMRAERDENVCRKDFTPHEADDIARQIEAIEGENAKRRRRATQNNAAAKVETSSANFAELGSVADIAADATGVSRETLRKIRIVREAAKQTAASAEVKAADAEMERTGKVDPAYRKIRNRDEAQAAEAVGMPLRDYQMAKAVVNAAEADPQTYGPVAEEMDRTGEIEAAYRKVKTKRRKPKLVTFDSLLTRIRDAVEAAVEACNPEHLDHLQAFVENLAEEIPDMAEPVQDVGTKPYDSMRDVVRLTSLRDKLAPNWNTAEDCGIIRQLFQRFSKEV